MFDSSFRRGLKAVVFDLDGVLIDSWLVAQASMASACDALQVAHPVWDQFRELMGLPLATILARLTLPAAAEPLFRTHAAAQIDCVQVYPGVEEVLKSVCTQGLRIGVLTGKDRIRSAAILDHTGVARFVDVLATPDDGMPKPHPRSLGAVLDKLNAVSDEAMFVGDSAVDMETARGCHVQAVFATWGAHRELPAADYDVRVTQPRELVELIAERMWAA